MCPTATGSVNISENNPGYEIIPTSFCGDNIKFQTFGREDISWYKTESSTSVYSQGSSLLINRSLAEEYIKDSIYRFWTKVSGCQKIPVYAALICDSCFTPKPGVGNTSFCHTDNDVTVTATGKNIRWYDYYSMELINVGNIYTTNIDIQKPYKIKLTQTTNYCESQHTTASLYRDICLPQFEISGNVWLDNKPYKNCQVVIYDNDSTIIGADTSITNSNGVFKFLTYKGAKKLKATANHSDLTDTWYGNTNNIDNSRTVILDANIAGLDIRMKNSTDLIDLAEEDCYNTLIQIVDKSSLLNSAKITIADYSGRNINYQNYSNFNSLYSDLKQGIYFYSITSEYQNCNGAFVK